MNGRNGKRGPYFIICMSFLCCTLHSCFRVASPCNSIVDVDIRHVERELRNDLLPFLTTPKKYVTYTHTHTSFRQCIRTTCFIIYTQTAAKSKETQRVCCVVLLSTDIVLC